MQKTTLTNSIHAFVQQAKRTTGTLCCVLAVFCVISCSSHGTRAHFHGSHTYTHMNSEYHHSYHGHSLDILTFELILLAAIAIVPPVLEAVGNLIDDVFVGIGPKEKKPIL